AAPTTAATLRRHGVCGKFVDVYGAGVASVPLANRATIGNMSPEFGSTAAIFPIDDVTLDYLRLTGRDEQAVALVEAYAKEQSLWHDPSVEPSFSEYLELDLGTVVPSIAGPKRPQDRILPSDSKAQFSRDIEDYAAPSTSDDIVDLESKHSFPASDPGAVPGEEDATTREVHINSGSPAAWSKPVDVTTPDGEKYVLDHGAVTLAAITSCTNT